MQKKPLAIERPDLIEEIHPKKNPSFNPSTATIGSEKKIWWLCSKGHEWEVQINKRTIRNQGCPYCSGRKVCADNCLATVNPKLAKEWNYRLNKDLSPREITLNTTRKVWWVCKKGHEWEAAISSRARGAGCLYCTKQKPTPEETLGFLKPELIDEWNNEKNGKLTPFDVHLHSARNVWWKCENGHNWQSKIIYRTKNGRECPTCSSVSFLRPDIAQEWHLELNKQSATEFVPGSHKKVWWKCPRGHAWKEAVCARTQKDDPTCPTCKEEKSIHYEYPHLINEWNDERNSDLTPKMFSVSSNKKVWWKCEQGHEWQAVIAKRTIRRQGCPECKKHFRSSFPEQAIHFYMAAIFEGVGKKLIDDRLEIDVYIPQLKLGIEYDGIRWHKNKHEKDLHKNAKCKELGIELLRVRESGLLDIEGSKNFWINKNTTLPALKNTCDELLTYMKANHPIEELITEDIQLDISAINEHVGKQTKEESLSKRYPALIAEWDFEKNENIKPEYFSYGSSREVWWKCKNGHSWHQKIAKRTVQNEGCPFCKNRRIGIDNSLFTLNPSLAREWNEDKNGDMKSITVGINSSKKAWWKCAKGHEWKALIVSRSQGSGCPYCSGKKASPEHNLETFHPSIAAEWSGRNSKPPSDYPPHSGAKVWWECKKGHEWKISISSRTTKKNNCPYCSGRYATEENNLLSVYPDISSEWHSVKNGDITPKDIPPNSGKKFWWECKKGHEWCASVNNRTNSKGCPYCSNQKVCHDNCLATLNPGLASEWHPTKNPKLSPYEVTPGSNKKAWWFCAKGHEWEANVVGRNKGRGCPYCSNQKVCLDNSLAAINPKLASEWHPGKNGGLSPENVTPGSNKKAWWMCERNHEWQTVIKSRHEGAGCKRCRLNKY